MATRTGANDTNLVERLGAVEENLFIAIKAEFDTEVIRVWNGIEDAALNGETYLGAGQLLSISVGEESSDLSSSGLTIGLSGMDSSVLNLALTENYANRPITVFMGYVDGASNNVNSSFTLYKGRMTSMKIADTPTGASITLECENRLVDLNRPSNLRYTKESQEFLHSGDTFFNRVASLQDKEIVWGKTTSVGGGGGGGGVGGRDDSDSRHRQLK